MDLQPPTKKKKIDCNLCIFCSRKLDTTKKSCKTVVNNPTHDGLVAIFNACDTRRDAVYESLWPLRDEVLNFELKIRFHKTCRASYTSVTNQKFSQSNLTPITSSSPDSVIIETGAKRDETSSFDVRRDCFVCAKTSNKREKLSQISTGTGLSTWQKVSEAAKRRKDDTFLLRMQPYSDLFAADAKYHRSCYSHYISERNIAAAEGKIQNSLMISLLMLW